MAYPTVVDESVAVRLARALIVDEAGVLAIIAAQPQPGDIRGEGQVGVGAERIARPAPANHGQLFFRAGAESFGIRRPGDIFQHPAGAAGAIKRALRSEEHTSELQSLMRISYAVFCL